LLEVRLLLPVALPERNLGERPKMGEITETLAGQGFEVVSALGLEPRIL
jgi:hypothetical protein